MCIQTCTAPMYKLLPKHETKLKQNIWNMWQSFDYENWVQMCEKINELTAPSYVYDVCFSLPSKYTCTYIY